MTEEEKPCPICALEDEEKDVAKPLSELLSFTANGTAAFFLSKATGEKVTSADVEKHKMKHMGLLPKPFSAIPKLWSRLDFSKKEDQAAAFNLDALHSLALSPGHTSPYVAMQGIKLLMDEAEKHKSDTQDVLTAIFSIVLKTVTHEDDRQKVAEALAQWQREQNEQQKG